MRRKGNALLIIIILIVIIGLAILLFARQKLGNNYQTTTGSYKVTSNNSDAGLSQDLNAIDSSLNNSSNTANGIDQGLNETPIPQPQ